MPNSRNFIAEKVREKPGKDEFEKFWKYFCAKCAELQKFSKILPKSEVRTPQLGGVTPTVRKGPQKCPKLGSGVGGRGGLRGGSLVIFHTRGILAKPRKSAKTAKTAKSPAKSTKSRYRAGRCQKCRIRRFGTPNPRIAY